MLLQNSNYYREYPTHILGEVYDSTAQFGRSVKKVKGTLTDALARIEAPNVKRYDHYRKSPTKRQTLTDEKVKAILGKTKEESDVKTVNKERCKNGVQCLANTIKKYNPKLTDEQIDVWVTYQVNQGIYDRRTIHFNDWQPYYQSQPDFLKEQFGKHTAYDGYDYVPNVLFYSGNIYRKLNQIKSKKSAIVAEVGEVAYQDQLEKLEAAIPAKLVITDGDENKLSLTPFDTFIWENISIEALDDGTIFDNPENVVKAFKSWLDNLPSEDFTHEKIISSKRDIKWHWIDRDNFPRNTDPEEKSERKRNMQIMGQKLFERFLFEALLREDRLRIEYLWNVTYNNYRDPDHELIPVGFEINDRFKGGQLHIRSAQREGVAYLNMHGTGIIAYDVGVGKTMTAILTAEDFLAKGLCKRPLVVVPNPTYDKWNGEIIGVHADKAMTRNGRKIKKGDLIAEGILPHRKINDYYNLGSGHLKKAINDDGSTIKVEEGSITTVTYEGLMKFGFDEFTFEELKNETISILSQADSKTGRQQALFEAKIEGMVEKGLRGAEVWIEQMGIDCIIVDEAHNFKNLFSQVKGEAQDDAEGAKDRGKRRYQIQGNGPSARALKLFLLNRFVQLRNNGRNTIGLTATPFTNSPLEIYSMHALFDYKGLVEVGMRNINRFFNNFVNEEYEMTWTAKGKFESRPVIRSFRNLPALQSAIFRYINYKTGEEANIERPEKVVLPLKVDSNGVTLPLQYQADTAIQPTSDQEYWFREIAKFAAEDENGSELDYHYPADHDGKVPGRVLIALNCAQLCTLSTLLLPFQKSNPDNVTPDEFLESSPKLQYMLQCIISVVRYHEKIGQEVSGQIIYINRGTEFFPHIKRLLVKYARFKEDEIGIIIGGMSQSKKERIKKEFLNGKKKIVIGSSTIREGIDLQKRTSLIYSLWLDWNPTDIKQLEGRGWRFGNIFSHIRICYPLIENSFDIFLFQKIGEKTSRINDIWSRANRQSVLKLEELNADELKLGLITDPGQYVDQVIKEEKTTLESALKVRESQQKELTNSIETVKKAKELGDRLRNLAEREVKGDSDLYSGAYRTEKLSERKKKIMAMKVGDFKSIYRIVKTFIKAKYEKSTYNAYMRKGVWKISWDGMYLNQDIDEHIKLVNKMNRIEKVILSKHNLTIQDDVTGVIDKLTAEIDSINERIEVIEGEEYRNELIGKEKKRREESAQRSRTIPERVEEFERLNFLLECSDAEVNGGNVCDIYGIERGSPHPKVHNPQPKLEINKKSTSAKLREAASNNTDDITDALDALKLLFELEDNEGEKQSISEAIEALEILI